MWVGHSGICLSSQHTGSGRWRSRCSCRITLKHLSSLNPIWDTWVLMVKLKPNLGYMSSYAKRETTAAITESKTSPSSSPPVNCTQQGLSVFPRYVFLAACLLPKVYYILSVLPAGQKRAQDLMIDGCEPLLLLGIELRNSCQCS